jgi:hypothetical protein
MKNFASWLLAAIIALIGIMIGGITGFIIVFVGLGLGFASIAKSGGFRAMSV